MSEPKSTEAEKSLVKYIVENLPEYFDSSAVESTSLLANCRVVMQWFKQQAEILGITDILFDQHDDGCIDEKLFEKMKELIK